MTQRRKRSGKLLALILAAFMLVGLLPLVASAAETEETVDITDKDLFTHYAYMKGYEDGTFKPSNNITRAEAAQIFYNLDANGEEFPVLTDGPDKTFTDVKSGAWFAEPVTALAKSGIINGYKDGSFLPSNNITRAEFITMVGRAMEMDSAGVTQPPFPDVSIKHWAVKEIDMAKRLKLIGGYDDGSFKPSNPITRAEVVTIINAALGRDPVFVPKTDKFPDVKINHWAAADIMEAGITHILYIDDESKEEVWLESFTVSYDANTATEGSVPVDKEAYLSGETTKAAEVGSLKKKEAVFTGWNTKADGTGTAYAVGAEIEIDEADIVLYAQWKTISDISKSTKPANVITGQGVAAAALPLPATVEVTLSDDSKATLPVVWNTASYQANNIGSYNLTGAITLPADGSITNTEEIIASITVEVVVKDYKVNFKDEDEVLSTATVRSGQKVTQPANPTKTGYTFANWLDKDKKNYDFNTPVLSDMDLTASFTLNKHKVDFLVDGEVYSSVTVNYGTAISKPETDPTKTGYTFKEWQLLGVKYNFTNPVLADLSINAVFDIVPVEDPAASIGTDGYATLADAIAAAETGETVLLLKNRAVETNLKAAAGVDLEIDKNVTLTIGQNASLAVDSISGADGSKIVNNGAILSKLSSDFSVRDAASKVFSRYSGNGVVFATQARYENANGATLGGTGVAGLDNGLTYNYSKGTIKPTGSVPISYLNVENGNSGTIKMYDNFFAFAYKVPEDIQSLNVAYFLKKTDGSYNVGDMNSTVDNVQLTSLVSGKMYVQGIAENYIQANQVLECTNIYETADGSFMELYYADFADAATDTEIDSLTMDGMWLLQSGISYTVKEGGRLRIAENGMLGYWGQNDKLVGKDATSRIIVEAGGVLSAQEDISKSNFYDASGTVIHSLLAEKDTTFAWDSGLSGWKMLP